MSPASPCSTGCIPKVAQARRKAASLSTAAPPSQTPKEWARKRSRRLAVTAGFFWRKEPAAQLRGLTKGYRPAASSSLFTFSKSAKLM